MMKKILSMLVILAMVLGLAACGNSGSAESATTKAESEKSVSEETPSLESEDQPSNTNVDLGEIKIAIILKTLASEYWSYVVAGAEAASKDLGVEVEIVGAASETAFDEQMNMIETMVSSGEYAAMAIAPLQPDMVATKISEASIPILAVDTKIPAPNVLTFIGTGNEAAGKMGGEAAAKSAIAAGKSNPKAVVISGVQGDLTAESRLAGYKEGFESAGGTILDIQYADAVADKALAVMENYLQNYDEIDAVLCNNDDMAMAAARAAKQAGREGIIFCGFDGISSGVQAIIDGDETMSVAQDPFQMGYKAVESCIKALQGEDLDQFIDTGCSIIDANNAQEYLDNLNTMLGK